MSANIKIVVQVRGRDHNGAWCLGPKGYPRYYSRGTFRDKYVHIVHLEQKLGRALKKDEECHHRNSDKLDFRDENLFVVDGHTHGWISKKQHYYLEHIKEPRDREDWMEYATWLEKQAVMDGVDFSFGAEEP